MSDKTGLFDWVSSISQTKKLKLNIYNERTYDVFMINRAFSQYQDCVLYANDMNTNVASKELHLAYMSGVIRPKKRFGKWAKPEKNETLDLLMEYYEHLSKDKVLDIMKLHTVDDIEHIKGLMNKGGKK